MGRNDPRFRDDRRFAQQALAQAHPIAEPGRDKGARHAVSLRAVVERLVGKTEERKDPAPEMARRFAGMAVHRLRSMGPVLGFHLGLRQLGQKPRTSPFHRAARRRRRGELDPGAVAAVEGKAPAGRVQVALGRHPGRDQRRAGASPAFRQIRRQRSAGAVRRLARLLPVARRGQQEARHLGAGGEYRKLFRLSVEVRGAEGAAAQRCRLPQRRLFHLGAHQFRQPRRDFLLPRSDAAQGGLHPAPIRRARAGAKILVAGRGHAGAGGGKRLWHAVGKDRRGDLSVVRSRPPAHAVHRLAGDRVFADASDEKSEPAVKADGARVIDIDVEIEA